MVNSIDIPNNIDSNKLIIRMENAESDIARLEDTIAQLQSSINALGITLAATQDNVHLLSCTLQDAGRMFQDIRF